MNKIYFLLVATAIISMSSCGGDSAGKKASGLGGPELSPEIETTQSSDTSQAAQTAQADSASIASVTSDTPFSSEVAAEITAENALVAADPVALEAPASSSSSIADAAANVEGAAISGTEDDDADTSGDIAELSPGDDAVSDETSAVDTAAGSADETPAVSAENVKVDLTLDTSEGKWTATSNKELFTAQEMKSAREKIAELQEKIKSLKEADKKDPQIALLKAEILAIRAKYGVNRFQTGIHTDWANQPLYLNAKVSKGGWYNLSITAMNINGKLPSFYTHFNVSVTNESTGKYLGGVQIKASETSNQSAGLLVYLPEGVSKLLINWTNDAYKQGEYDANINFTRIALKYKGDKGPKFGATRRAHQYSYVDGRFFWDGKTVRTYWANQTIGFDYSNLKAGKYKVTVKAKNYGVLPKDYKNFIVRVNSGDGAEATLEIKADEKNFHKGTAVIDITGPTSIYLTWLNDAYKPDKNPVEDANIEYELITMKRIGESERSAAVAYLLGTRPGNMVMTLGSIGLLGIVLGAFYVLNRRRTKQFS